MLEDLPVLETEVIEPDGVDLSLYRRIGEEVTRVVKHKPRMLVSIQQTPYFPL